MLKRYVAIATGARRRGILAHMNIKNRVAIVTGGASGIGRAVAERFVTDGARAVVIADVETEALHATADEIGADAFVADVGDESAVQRLVEHTENRHGAVDVLMSNAGVFRAGDESSSDADWLLNWEVHVLAHVYAARAVVKKMAARGEGYLINTSSAAGLLSHINSATYSTTKHAAIGFAEYLSITYGQQGVRVSVLCPQSVRTAMTVGRGGTVASVDGMIEPQQLADYVIEGMERETFLMLPHPEVETYMRRKTNDYNRWLGGMRRLKQKYDDKAERGGA